MRIVAVTNAKGGTAKTATAVNLVAACGANGGRSLVVDLDPQGNATASVGVQDDGGGLLNVLTGGRGLHELVTGTAVEGVDLVPSGLALNGLDAALAAMPDKSMSRAPAFILRPRLRELAKSYDLVAVDCPPALGTLTWNALVAATEVLVPVEPHGHGTEAVARMVTVAEEARNLNPDLDRVSIVPVRVDQRTSLARGVLDVLQSTFGEQVTRTVIRSCVRVAESPLAGRPVVDYAPASNGATDYRALWDELRGVTGGVLEDGAA